MERTMTNQFYPAWTIEASYPAITDDEAREIKFDVTDIAMGGMSYSVWDMWKHEEYAVTDGVFSAEVNHHGARLFKIKVK